MTVLNVQLFGHFSVTFDGVALTTLHTSRLQELFAYIILLRAAPISRYPLACEFWPDSSEAQAHTNLRNLIHQLRQAFPQSERFIHSDANFLEWCKESSFTLDVAEFERCLEVVPGKEVQREALEQAVQIYHGDLLHRKVAEAYLRLDEASPRMRNAEIASHYEHAGLPLQAIKYYRLAAESAARIFANAEAQRHLQRAVERALAQSFSLPKLWRSQIYRKMSDALVQQYQHPQAFAALDQAEQALRLLSGGDTALERQEWIQIRLARSRVSYWCNLPEQIDAIVQHVRPMVEADGRIDQQIELLRLQSMARLRHERYRVSEGTVEIQRCRLELAETLADPYGLAMAQFELGFGLLWHGDPPAAREWLDKGYDAMSRKGDRLWQVRSLAYLSIVSRKLDDREALRGQTQQLLELAFAIGELTYQGIGLANQGWLAWRDGDAARAEQLCKSADEVWSKFGGNVFHGLADWVLLAIAAARCDSGGVETCARALLDPNPSYQPIEEPMAGLLKAGIICLPGQRRGSCLCALQPGVGRSRSRRRIINPRLI